MNSEHDIAFNVVHSLWLQWTQFQVKIYSNVQLKSMAKRTCWGYSLFTKWIGRKLSQSLSTVLKQMIKFGLLIDFDYIRRVICMLNWVNEWCLAYENGLRKTKSANCLTDHNLLLFTIYTTAFRFFLVSMLAAANMYISCYFKAMAFHNFRMLMLFFF